MEQELEKYFCDLEDAFPYGELDITLYSSFRNVTYLMRCVFCPKPLRPFFHWIPRQICKYLFYQAKQ